MTGHGRLAFIAALSVLATPALAKVKDWKVTPSSKQAVVIMDSVRQPVDYTLVFSRNGNSGFGSRVYMMGVKPYDLSPYAGRTLEPGIYRLNSLSQQSQWSTCFGSGTIEFTVEPGKVYYLGSLNIDPLLKDLQLSALRRGKGSLSSGALAVGWEPEVKPAFAPPTPEDVARLQAFMARTMPRTTAPIHMVHTVATSFNTGGGKKFMQVCG